MDYYLDTLQSIKTNYLNWSMDETSEDNRLLDLMKSISFLFQSTCGTQFVKASYTEFFDTKRAGTVVPNYNSLGISAYLIDPGYQVIEIRQKPIDPTVTVQVFYDPEWKFPAESQIDPDLIKVDYDTDTILIASHCPASKKSLKVVYTGGYSTTTDGGRTVIEVPADLRHAYGLTVAYNNEIIKRRAMGLRQLGDSDTAVDFATFGAIPTQARQILYTYRKSKSFHT